MLARSGYGLGAAALHGLLGAPPAATAATPRRAFPNFAPRAKRVIFLFQAGGPSHLDLLDYKPAMKGRFNQDIPPPIFGTQRVTGMVAQQDRFPVVPTMYGFKQYGKSGLWLSELLPHTGRIADEICVLRGDEYRGHQSRSGHHVYPDRQPVAGPALHGIVGRLWPGQRE